MKKFKLLTILAAAITLFAGCKNALADNLVEDNYCQITVAQDTARTVITSSDNLSQATSWTLKATNTTDTDDVVTDTKSDSTKLTLRVRKNTAYNYELKGTVQAVTTKGYLIGTLENQTVTEDTSLSFTVKPQLATDISDPNAKGAVQVTLENLDLPAGITEKEILAEIKGISGNAQNKVIIDPTFTVAEANLTYTEELPTGIYSFVFMVNGKEIQKKYFAVESGLKTSLNYDLSEYSYIGMLSRNYLVLHSDGEFTLNASRYWSDTLEYSVNGNSWNTWDKSDSTGKVSNKLGNNYYVLLRGINHDSMATNVGYGYNSRTQFKMISDTFINCYGNIMTLIDYENPPEKTPWYSFYNLFKDCDKLRTAPELPATTLTGYCYYEMFSGCTSLVEAPVLPATTLNSKCYAYMFNGCTSLTKAPELPVTTFESSSWYNCYEAMFKGCTSLTKAPVLPAKTLSDKCYYEMFRDCTSLTEAPELPATTLRDSCYVSMFRGCTSLTKVPELPAITLSAHCYEYMFYGCTGMIEAPDLSATTLSVNCYAYMFSKCTSLTEAPDLPVTTLSGHCYEHMFDGCTSLNKAPELPATTLIDACYSNMFNGCTSLTEPPELPATTPVYMCYYEMFSGCKNLTKAPSIPSPNSNSHSCYTYMFSGCSKLRIKEGEGEASNLIVTLPEDAKEGSSSDCYCMFSNTGGTFTSTPNAGKSYYWY